MSDAGADVHGSNIVSFVLAQQNRRRNASVCAVILSFGFDDYCLGSAVGQVAAAAFSVIPNAKRNKSSWQD